MFPRLPPQVTKPQRTIMLVKPTDALTPQPKDAPFSPLSFFQRNSSLSPSSSAATPLTLRSPVIHFFVCDYGNAKVKTLTEQFVQILTKNGIKVFTEKYMTHQPGYQVRAASLSSLGDFFFQIHSKTAGPGHVRLYESGQPNRMTAEESVAAIWSNWRSKCGALSQEEVDLLSKDRMMFLLKEFAGLQPQDLDIASIQSQSRDAIERGITLKPILVQLRGIEAMLQDGKSKISAAKTMSCDWIHEPGGVVSRIVQAPPVCGLSTALKEVLINVIDQTLKKVRAIDDVLQRKTNVVFAPQTTMNHALPNSDSTSARSDKYRGSSLDGEQKQGDGSSWGMMIESADEDKIGSIQIASYGDGNKFGEHSIEAPVFLLDEY